MANEPKAKVVTLTSDNYKDWERFIKGEILFKDCEDISLGLLPKPTPVRTIDAAELANYDREVLAYQSQFEAFIRGRSMFDKATLENMTDPTKPAPAPSSMPIAPVAPTRPIGTVTNDAEIQTWVQKDNMAKGIIIRYIDSHQSDHLQGLETSVAYQNKLKVENEASPEELRLTLMSCIVNRRKKTGETIKDHILELTSDTRRLFDLGTIDHNTFLVMQILNSLTDSPEYRPAIQGIIAHFQSIKKMEVAYTRNVLIASEEAMSRGEGKPAVPSDSALFAGGGCARIPIPGGKLVPNMPPPPPGSNILVCGTCCMWFHSHKTCRQPGGAAYKEKDVTSSRGGSKPSNMGEKHISAVSLAAAASIAEIDSGDESDVVLCMLDSDQYSLVNSCQ
jgi:hypothetical protein